MSTNYQNTSTTSQVRQSFLDFFKKHDHVILPSSPLIPHNDPTLLFTNAGMVQFKNWFTGTQQPQHNNVVTAQKCVRAGGKHNDLEQVGHTARHHTFFEMLGNFSFGDYFKEQAILLAWNYLTKDLCLAKDRLYITVYHEDMEALKLWKSITSFSDDRIIRISTNDNFWSMGATGPCGPCSEIFYDHGDHIWGGLPGTKDQDGDRYMELWNLVFMQFEQREDGTRTSLPRPCIDTGAGLERLTSVLQGKSHNYETDIFQKIINAARSITGIKEHLTSYRVIADHLRAMCFLIADGVMPSNEGRGYVLRRIMRRCIRHIHQIGYKGVLLHRLAPVLMEEMGGYYKELTRASSVILSALEMEERKFNETLDNGMKILRHELEHTALNTKMLSGATAFKLYDTYGFPLDLTKDILLTEGVAVDEEEFNTEMAAQRARAKAAWAGSGDTADQAIWYNIHDQSGATDFVGYTLNETEALVQAIVVDNQLVESATDCEAYVVLNETPFYAESGGQISDIGTLNEHIVSDVKKRAGGLFVHHVKLAGTLKTNQTVVAKIDTQRRAKIKANHSATHLLHHALRQQLGNHVAQKGSIVMADKFRFDFSHAKPLGEEELSAIEAAVNALIIENYEVNTNIMDTESAIDKGAMALFGEKYGDQVRVVSMGESLELCGGTHAHQTGDIGFFKIISEESIASGVRRIEAITGLAGLKYAQDQEKILKTLGLRIKCPVGELLHRVEGMMEENKKLQKNVSELRLAKLRQNMPAPTQHNGISLIIQSLIECDDRELRTLGSDALQKIGEGIVLLYTINNDKISVIITVSKALSQSYDANRIAQQLAPCIDARGGGNAQMSQLGGTKIHGAADMVKAFKDALV
jgi:alanyl-tRNA synthetase